MKYKLFLIFIIIILFFFHFEKKDTDVLNELCRQSPINIQPSNYEIIDNNILDINYLNKDIIAVKSDVKNNNIHYNISNDNYLIFNNTKFKLLQYHFHKPSEHKLNNNKFTMELHMVHKSLDDKEFLVLGFFIIPGKSGPFDSSISLEKKVNVNIKKNINKFYYYHGSLTTDPFSENVIWIVADEPITSSTINKWDNSLGPARKTLEHIYKSELLTFKTN